jgi:hypothetical protein
VCDFNVHKGHRRWLAHDKPTRSRFPFSTLELQALHLQNRWVTVSFLKAFAIR